MNNLLYVPNNAAGGSISRGASPYKGSRSRAGDPNLQTTNADPNHMMLKEIGAGIGAETMQKNLSKDREYERIYQQLHNEFSRIDLNRDGTITKEEIIRFLNEQTNGTVDTDIAEQIFKELDDDGSGVILLEEFIANYFEKQTAIKEAITALEESIANHQKNRENLVLKFKEQRAKERVNNYGLDDDAGLSVRIVEARDLKALSMAGAADPYVILKLGGQTQKSNFVRGELNPVWNEVFTFDIESGKEVLEVLVNSRSDFGSDGFLGHFQLSLDELKDQVQHDEWLELEAEKPNQPWQGKIRLVLHYIFSKTKMLTGYINLWTQQIENEEAELKDLKQVLKHMESPFGFIQGFTMEQKAYKNQEERNAAFEEKKQEALTNWEMPPAIAARMEIIEVKEKAVEKRLDAVASRFAKKVGYESVPWFQLTWILLWLYTFLTFFVMFYRPDFINLTICTTALFMMFSPHRITKTRFRFLVLTIFLSLFYDLLWFYMMHTEYSSEPKTDGSGEARIRKFSLMSSYASFLLRIFVALVFWKDSMDFAKIILNQEEVAVVQEKRAETKNKGLFLRNQL